MYIHLIQSQNCSEWFFLRNRCALETKTSTFDTSKTIGRFVDREFEARGQVDPRHVQPWPNFAKMDQRTRKTAFHSLKDSTHIITEDFLHYIFGYAIQPILVELSIHIYILYSYVCMYLYVCNIPCRFNAQSTIETSWLVIIQEERPSLIGR